MGRPVNIFYHVAFLHDYMQIVREQFEMIISSGLYDRANKIYIGCVGDYGRRDEIIAYMKPYKQKVVIEHITDLQAYEFHTLKIVRREAHAQPLAYALYLHCKSASNPGHQGGKYWRDSMNYWNIKRWRDAVEKLDYGYDMYGSKVLGVTKAPAHRLHVSGNIWWGTSEYLKTLKPVETLNMMNRWDAEFWATSNSPVIYNADNTFIDYNTKGEWCDPVLFDKQKIIDEGIASASKILMAAAMIVDAERFIEGNCEFSNGQRWVLRFEKQGNEP